MTINKDKLRYIGASLYWGEGTKARKLSRGGMIYAVEFTNVDELMIVIFLQFLRKIIGAVEERIRAQIFLYPEHDDKLVMDYWIKVTGIPSTRFQKIIHLQQASGRFKPSKYGIMKIRYAHKEHFLKIQGIIDEIKGEVAQRLQHILGKNACESTRGFESHLLRHRNRFYRRID